MSCTTQIAAASVLLRRAASLAKSQSYPAWIDAAENGLSSPVVMPRVRDALVLRLVAGRRTARLGRFHHAPGPA